MILDVMKKILSTLFCVIALLMCVTCQENNIFLSDVPVQPEEPSEGNKDSLAMLEANIDCVKGGIDALKSDDESVFKQRFENWLNGQDFIEEFSMEDFSDYWEYDITYKDGTNSYFVFFKDDKVGYGSTKRMNRSSDTEFVSVPEEDDEQIISQGNLKAMIFEPLDMWSKDNDENFEEILEKSPLEYSYLHSYENLDALCYIQNYDVVLLTNTHGFNQNGSFSVSDNEVNRDYCKKNIDKKLVKATFVWLSSYLVEDVLVVPLNGVGLNNMKEKSLLYGDYCWSALNGEFNNIFKGNLVGYNRRTNALTDNYVMVDFYFTHLFNGFTHENAFKNTKYKNECISSNNKHLKLRFFSISTGDADDIEDKNGAYIVDGTINGYDNLKDNVEYRIYYSKESFSRPNDDIDFKEFLPMGNGDVEVELNELDFDTEYFYSVAMAYNDRVYHGEVKSFKTEIEDKEEPDFVDLGLPSGVKWARYNIDAYSPNEWGTFYTWYDIANDILKKMPTEEDFEELFEYCTFSVEVTGVRCIGLNGNSIFLPFAGYKNNSGWNYRDERCYLWTKTEYEYNIEDAICACMSIFEGKTPSFSKYTRMPIRLVRR